MLRKTFNILNLEVPVESRIVTVARNSCIFPSSGSLGHDGGQTGKCINSLGFCG